MAQYALDRVLSVVGADAIDNKVVFLADRVTDPSLSFTSETEDIVDARNNVVMVLENGRGATFSASNAFFNTQILAAQVGGNLESAAGEEVVKYDILTLDNSKSAVLSATPADDSTYTVYALNNDNSLTMAASVAGTYSNGKITVESMKAKDKILVRYTAKIAEGEKIVALADASNKLMKVTAEVLLRELCNEKLYYGFIELKGKLSGEAEWSMTRDGGHGFEIRCMPAYCEDPRELVKVIVVDGDKLVEADGE